VWSSPTFRQRDAITVSIGFARYVLTVLPLARHELRRWERRARAIPDPVLRSHAVRKLDDEGLNPEAAAVFSVFAPLTKTAAVIRLVVAFQVLYDYLDAVTEQRVADPLRNGRQLHRALVDAVDPKAAVGDYYRHHPQYNDGDYVCTLIRTCRRSLTRLSATPDVIRVAARAARRCAEGQTRTNAAPQVGVEQLRRWADDELARRGFLWWEVAAGAAASLAALAILAASADPGTTKADAERIDAAYHPPIGAVTTFLDSLIDFGHDAESTDHRYLAHYATVHQMTDRLVAQAVHAREAALTLRHGSRHAVLVAAIAAYYLSAPEARRGFAAPVAARVLESLGPSVTVPYAVMRCRRLLRPTARRHARTRTQPA
jgi:tetraprenyl-beta-curcumene synthase